jgi:hydroxymethylbilane synthase
VEKEEIILGTRGSALAVRQTQFVAAAVQRAAPAARVAVKTITTRGDRARHVPLAALGGTGVFVKELEDALLDGRIDAAVHSLKDLPTQTADGLIIAAVPAREDSRDALLSREGRTFWSLRNGSRVGTSSPRRRAQLLHLRRDLDVLDLRGNLDTRLRRLDEGRYDAILLAAAGLLRLELADRITETLPFSAMLPAAGQGALAIQIRAADGHLRRLLRALDDAATRRAVGAERAFLRQIGGGCHAPVGAHASLARDHLELEGCIAAPDGTKLLRDWIEGDAARAEELGVALAERLLRQGGAEVVCGTEGAAGERA